MHALFLQLLDRISMRSVIRGLMNATYKLRIDLQYDAGGKFLNHF